MDTTECPRCDSTEFEESVDQCDAICDGCGLVIHDWSQVGEIDPAEPIDGVVSGLTGSPPDQWSDFCTVSNSTEANVAKAIDELETIGAKLGVGVACKRETVELLSRGFLERATDGRAFDAVVAGMVHLGSRKCEFIIPLSKLAQSTQRDETELNSLVRQLQSEADIQTPVPKPHHYLHHVIDETALPDDAAEDIEQRVTSTAVEEFAIGKNPASVTAALVYAMTDHGITQREIAEVVGVSKETIRVRLNELRQTELLETGGIENHE